MKLIQVWSNNVYLPNSSEKQSTLFLSVPTINKYGISLPITIGFFKHANSDSISIDYKLIIFGFGFVYNSNWDI